MSTFGRWITIINMSETGEIQSLQSPESYGVKLYLPEESKGWTIREVPIIFHEPVTSDLIDLIQQNELEGISTRFGSDKNLEDFDTPQTLQTIFQGEKVSIERQPLSKAEGEDLMGERLLIRQSSGEGQSGRGDKSLIVTKKDGKVINLKYTFSSRVGGDEASMTLDVALDTVGESKDGTITKQLAITRSGDQEVWEVSWEYWGGKQRVIKARSGKSEGGDTIIDFNSQEGVEFSTDSSFSKEQLLSAMPGFSSEELLEARKMFEKMYLTGKTTNPEVAESAVQSMVEEVRELRKNPKYRKQMLDKGVNDYAWSINLPDANSKDVKNYRRCLTETLLEMRVDGELSEDEVVLPGMEVPFDEASSATILEKFLLARAVIDSLDDDIVDGMAFGGKGGLRPAIRMGGNYFIDVGLLREKDEGVIKPFFKVNEAFRKEGSSQFIERRIEKLVNYLKEEGTEWLKYKKMLPK